jgi:hypothetical protein
MILLLSFTFLNAVCSELSDNTVFVHEWGVILLDETYLNARGCPDGYIDEYGYFRDYPMADVTAPVVYFYGDNCRGDFTVDIPDGSFTLMDPYPDTLLIHSEPAQGQTAIWEGISIRQEIPETEASWDETATTRSPQWDNCFSWAVPIWRLAPSNRINHPSSGYDDKFIYYESSIADPEMFTGENYNCSGEALVFFAEDGVMECVKVTVPGEIDASGETLSDLEIMAVLSSWRDNRMLPEEIYGLWQTWKPLLRTRCEGEYLTMMLFPLSESQESMVSLLRFEPEENLRVEYERLLLGLGSI